MEDAIKWLLVIKTGKISRSEAWSGPDFDCTGSNQVLDARHPIILFPWLFDCSVGQHLTISFRFVAKQHFIWMLCDKFHVIQVC